MGRSSVQVTASGTPTVRRRELGALLRALRSDSGLTIDEVAQQLLCSPSKISRMETGLRGTSQRDIRDLCDLYGVTDTKQRQHLTELAKGGREQAWWQPYELRSSFATYVGLEAEALRISNYDPGVVPGLLQTPEYARAVEERTLDERTLERPSDEATEEMLEVRRRRQAILTRTEPSPPEFCGIVDEAALHRIVGSPAIMSAALERVVHASDLPNVGIQVLPYEAGAHPALDSTFVLLEFRDQVPPVVYVEGLVGQVWLARPLDIGKYKQVFERLGEMSLDTRESVNLIAKLASEYNRR